MQKKNMFVSLIQFVACASLVMGAATLVQAQEKKPEATKTEAAQVAKVDGAWKWTQPGRNGGADRTNTLTLKVEGAKLTGNLSAPGRGGAAAVETPITDGTIKDGQVAFTVTREFNGNKMVSKYTGKVEGDTIKGNVEVDRNGQTNSRDWEAKRQ